MILKEGICPTCGAATPSDLLADKLVGKQRAIYEAVLSAGTAGISRDGILQQVYGHDPNGGPSSLSLVSVTIRVINRKIRDDGYMLQGTPGPGGRYRVRKIIGVKTER